MSLFDSEPELSYYMFMMTNTKNKQAKRMARFNGAALTVNARLGKEVATTMRDAGMSLVTTDNGFPWFYCFCPVGEAELQAAIRELSEAGFYVDDASNGKRNFLEVRG